MGTKIVYLTITLLILSCTNKVDCPGFPKKYLVWMPYIQGEKISFTDGIDTLQLMVDETYIVEPYTAKRFKFLDEDRCDSYASCSITGDSLPGITYSSDNYDSGADFKISFQLNSGSNVFQFRDNNGESFLTYWPYQHNEILNSYDNGCKVFYDVIKIESDTLLVPETLLPDIQVYQLYIGKNIGIIQFKDRLNHKTWSLIQ